MCILSQTISKQSEDAAKNFQDRIFFHGTSKRSARKVLKEGLRDYSSTAETPRLKYKAKQGIARWMHGGVYGQGTYITCDWRSALYFGPVLFRVELDSGTRIVHLDTPPDGKILDRLKREFGNEIFKASPRKVIPKNKRLTLEEAIQLARYHAEKTNWFTWRRSSQVDVHKALMFDLRSILVRYGIHGWGDVMDLNGIVIFATDRLKVREVVLSMPTPELRDEASDPGKYYRGYPSLDALVSVTRSARNRGAKNTLEWVKTANEILTHTQNSILPNL